MRYNFSVLLAFILMGVLGCGSGLANSVNDATSLQIAANLASAVTGMPYTSALQATGGSAHYHWSIASGAVPGGLQLQQDSGVISGTPVQTGTSTFQVVVADDSTGARSLSDPVSLSVVPLLKMPGTALANGFTGVVYAKYMTPTGGLAPYSVTVQSGQLPPGLFLQSNLLIGIPTRAGTYPFTLKVTDSSSPKQVLSIPTSIQINPPVNITTTTVPQAVAGSPYAFQLAVTPVNSAQTWTMLSGALPSGISLSPGGRLSGTPQSSGTASFTVLVTDRSAQPFQADTQALALTVVSSLSAAKPTLPAATQGKAFSASLSATGGMSPYTWTTSGQLPPGVSLASSGVFSGTPSAAGTYNFTATVTDTGTPAQSQQLPLSITVAAGSAGNTWFVRKDGGSRYSSNMPHGQCDGLTDGPYPGSGTNQPCAFNDARFLWQDGSRATGSTQSSFPSYGWVGQGGDTYIIRGSIQDGVSWRVGYPNNSSAYDAASGVYFGIPGDPYSSGAPVPLSGTSEQHTRILGENFAACHTAGAKTQLHGGFGANMVLDMAGASYVDVACLDITDFSSCGRAAQTNTCSTQPGTLDDYATNGIRWSRTSTNDTLTDVHIHGMAATGMIGPTGDGVTMDYMDVIGNAASGWNTDVSDGTTGTGVLSVKHYNISWNGCTEQYPITDALPYQDCTDDNIGGYGDGFGTASLPSNPAWNITFDQGIVSYNTQDGLDALHLTGQGSSISVSRTSAFSNMGQQIKIGGASSVIVNNIITTNCNAMRQAIPGTPSGYDSRLTDFCRAADSGMVAMVGHATNLTMQQNTIYSASSTAVEIDCDTTYGSCDATSTIDFENNIFVGFLNDNAAGYVGGGSGDYSNYVYNGSGASFFTNRGSIFNRNITYHAKSSWACPAQGESGALCLDPGLSSESWPMYGPATVSPTLNSIALRAGASLPAVTLDFFGSTRNTPPTIGAVEH